MGDSDLWVGPRLVLLIVLGTVRYCLVIFGALTADAHRVAVHILEMSLQEFL